MSCVTPTASRPLQLWSALAPLLLALPAAARAQQLIGYVPLKDAEVTGSHDTVDGRAVLAGSVSVTAKDRTAAIALGRGGTLQVCQTSVLHLTQSRAAATDGQLAAPLLLSLDRGAVEIDMHATPSDALMTPDLRFGVKAAGPLKLSMRVAQNGDTCVENRGPGAPTLLVSDVFGQASYQLNSGQHVLFEHGSLREVVDNESSPCGCPRPAGMSLADALLAPGPGNTPASGQAAQANAQHPFPAAQSEGLAPVPPVPQAPAGQVHAQVSERLSYNAAEPAAPAAGEQGSAPAPVAPPPPAAPAAPRAHGFGHAVGRFFKRLFGR